MKNKTNKKGFTLVEVIVTVSIFSLIFIALSVFIIMFYRSYSYNWQQALAINEARKGVETMVKELREARVADDGSYPIVLAKENELIFYSDIDKDGAIERVRYFLGSSGSGSLTKECVSYDNGGSCNVSFSNFLTGSLVSANLKVSVEGDFGWSQEYADIYADNDFLDKVCKTGCSDCAGSWQGDTTFDVTNQANDNSIQFIADANSRVNNFCDWQEPNHSMKAKFEFSWTENISSKSSEFKKGIINPTDSPVTYPPDQEEIQNLSNYVRNTTSSPVFRYFDKDGKEITDLSLYLKDIRLIEVDLIINVDKNRLPDNFELKSVVQLRNLKEE